MMVWEMHAKEDKDVYLTPNFHDLLSLYPLQFQGNNFYTCSYLFSQ